MLLSPSMRRTGDVCEHSLVGPEHTAVEVIAAPSVAASCYYSKVRNMVPVYQTDPDSNTTDTCGSGRGESENTPSAPQRKQIKEQRLT